MIVVIAIGYFQNITFTYCPPSFRVHPACFYALAMSDFWACMPPFGDSIFLPSVRLLGSLRSECLFLGYACFSLVLLLVVGSVVGRPFPFPVLRLPNCRGTLPQHPSTTVVPSVFFRLQSNSLSASFPSSRLQLTLPTTVWGVSPVPPSVFAFWLPLVGFRLWVRFTSCTSFPSPFFVSHTITLTPSSHDLRPLHH